MVQESITESERQIPHRAELGPGGCGGAGYRSIWGTHTQSLHISSPSQRPVMLPALLQSQKRVTQCQQSVDTWNCWFKSQFHWKGCMSDYILIYLQTGMVCSHLPEAVCAILLAGWLIVDARHDPRGLEEVAGVCSTVTVVMHWGEERERIVNNSNTMWSVAFIQITKKYAKRPFQRLRVGIENQLFKCSMWI